MRVSARIDEHPGETFGRRVPEPIAKLALVVRLPAIDARTAIARDPFEPRVDRAERFFSVDGRFARSEQLQVRPRQNQNRARRCRLRDAPSGGDWRRALRRTSAFGHYESCSISFGAAVRIK